MRQSAVSACIRQLSILARRAAVRAACTLTVATAMLIIGAVPSLAAGTYTVQSGDSLFQIAVRFNVGISDLATINHIYDVNSIYVGETLTLPAPLPAGYYGSNPVYALPTSPTYTVPAPVQTYRIYTVQPGDYLGAIAARYGVSASALLALNAVSLPNPSLLYVGSTLLIPDGSPLIGLSNNTPSMLIPVVPPANPPAVMPAGPNYHGNFYVVQPGDTLYSIAARFGQDMYTIARVNGILNLTAIYAGTSLLIP